MPKSVAQMLFCACIMFNGSANAFDLTAPGPPMIGIATRCS